MRRIFTILLLLSCALAWPAAARAQDTVEGCTGWGLLRQEWSQDHPVNPKTGVVETRISHQGNVDITCDNIRIVADHVEVILERSFLTATGNVVFIQQGTRINATRAEFDLKQKTGTFYVANGRLALQNKPGASPSDHKMDKSLFGTLEPDAYFFGDKIEKLGPRTYRLTHGWFTTCVQPTPRWKMDESSATITVNDHIVLHNMVLRVKDVPFFYVPMLYYPLNSNDRATGFLLPAYGSSTVRGFTLSNAFFWAIDRSEDATFFYDWFSKIGQAYGTEYRYAGQPGSGGDARIYTMDLQPTLAADGTVAVPARREFDAVGSMSQAISSNVRLQARMNYFSSVATEQLLQQNLFTTLNSDRFLSANLYGTWGAWRLAGLAEVHDYFTGLAGAARLGSAPRITFSYAQSSIGHSKIYAGFNTEYVSILKQGVVGDPTTKQDLTRLDINPTIRAPIGNLSFLTINTSASWRFTSWSQSLNPNGVQVATPIDRQLMVLQASVVGPVFTKVFDTPTSGYADKFKHVIEPSFTVQHVTNISNFNQIVQIEPAVDAIVGGATSMTYGLTNRVLARRLQPNGPPVAREIFNVGISQSYYTDQQAAAYDQQYQTSLQSRTPSNFSPVVLQTTATPTDHVSGQMRLEYDWQHGALRSMSTGTNVNLPATLVNATWTRQFLIPSLTGFSDPTALANTLSVSTTVRAPDNHLSGTWSWNHDFTNRYMLQQRFTANYNSQCCGVAFEFQTVYLPNLAPGLNRDRRFTVSFTLAGIGTFSPPFGAFGGAGVK